ncbi:XRE family transcriptional regulator [Ktedonospora formicarum]|uniref:HTH cro/C1-type domain-containing protein n=1 Tax=Ktedonospora formicarum TaxID=2778364 RepID=A0A8J3I8I5_9CHLR|nr:XRE family transcriptional regulator [Ktedonospora formicarum]GHO49411.1 hypothetical protein KSX_75740 [Ktedonospora formicarum]
MQPNELLLRERQRRGWTREFVAERIGIADPKTIGRWERGVASPSAYFLQKLCDLYARSPQELGLLYEDEVEGRHTEGRLEDVPTHASSSYFLHDPALPLPHMEMGGLVGRDYPLLYLRERLCTQERFSLTALYGLPGVGKTALVIALAYDETIEQRFQDGILWASLGQEPDTFDLLRRWGGVLGMEQAIIDQYSSPGELAKAIRTRIGWRRILFILDDVWTNEAAMALKIGGPNCSYLLTTRIPWVASSFAHNGAYYVSELDMEASMDLLERMVPDIHVRRWSALRSVISTAGGLPLVLYLIGKYLQRQSYGHQSRRLQRALAHLYHAEARLQLSAPRTLVEQQKDGSTTYSLSSSMERSVKTLDKPALRTLAALSVFPSKPHTFDEGAALAVCHGLGNEETLDQLSDSGLLESERGRYMLHPVVAEYARSCYDPGGAYERMLSYFCELVKREAPEAERLEPEKHNILTALKIACERDLPEALIQGSVVLLPMLQRFGLYEVAEMYLKRSERFIDRTR